MTLVDRRTEHARSLRLADLWAMLGIVGLGGVLMIAWSHLGHEITPIRNGIGYDGHTYAAIVRDPFGIIFGHRLDVHRVQRIVPSIVVYAMLRPFGLSTSNPAILVAFQVLNYVLMAASAFMWWQVTNRLRLSWAAGWIGFLALVVNYGLLKFQAFVPVMTDTAGFALGMALVWCFAFRATRLLPLLAILSAFTWPTAGYAALILYVLTRTDEPPRPSRWWGVGVTALAAVAIPVLAVRGFRCGRECGSQLMVNSVLPSLVPIAVVFLAAWIYLMFRPLVELATVPNVLRAVHWGRLLIAVTILVVIAKVQHDLANPSFRTASRTLYNTMVGGIAKPGGFLVAHAVYFGPGLLLLIVCWRRVVEMLRGMGVGPVVLTGGFMFLALTNEARILMNVWPWFVLLMALAVDRLRWGVRETSVFALLTLVTSRLWFPIEHGPRTGDWHKYPDQFYAMSLGLKMTAFSYALFGVCCLLIVGLFVYMVRSTDRSETLPVPG